MSAPPHQPPPAPPPPVEPPPKPPNPPPPPQQTPERRRQHNHNDYKQNHNASRRHSGGWWSPRLGGSLSPGQLNARVLRDNVRDPQRDQADRSVVIALLQKRNRFSAKAPHFAVGKNRLQTVPDRRPILTILDREKNQYPAVSLLAPDAPGLV